MNRLLTIGEFSRRSQLSLKALRLYDRLGLLTPAVVDPNSRYRRYDESQLYTARLIAMLRQLDMPLSTVAKVVAAGDRGAELLAAYWSAIERRHDGQRRLSEFLRSSLADGTGRFGGYEIRERDVAEQHVRCEHGEPRITELDGFIRGALERLGGHGAGVIIIFHGPVDADRQGPVEVCVPAPNGPDTWCDPAHHEAYVRLTKAQWGFPQILSAYDAVEQWVHSYSLEWAGSPREVYLCDPDDAGPDDEVCDVAIPLTLPQGQTGSLAP